MKQSTSQCIMWEEENQKTSLKVSISSHIARQRVSNVF